MSTPRRKKRESVPDHVVHAAFGPWTCVKYYCADKPANADGARMSPAKVFKGSARSSMWTMPLPKEWSQCGGVYEWKCSLEGRSVVFYLGKASSFQRISGERSLQPRNLGPAPREFFQSIFRHTEVTGHTATFHVRVAPAHSEQRARRGVQTLSKGVQPRAAEDELLGRFDYACNEMQNGACRIADAFRKLGIEVAKPVSVAKPRGLDNWAVVQKALKALRISPMDFKLEVEAAAAAAASGEDAQRNIKKHANVKIENKSNGATARKGQSTSKAQPHPPAARAPTSKSRGKKTGGPSKKTGGPSKK